MQTKKVKVFLLFNIAGGFETLSSADMSTGYCANDYTLLGTGTVTINMIGQKEVVLSQIEKLKASKKTIRANCQLEIESIDDRIQSLLAIGHEGVEI